MSVRSVRYRSNETNNIWPGFVDVLATLLIVIIFVLMVFTVSQIYLSDAISGRDKALESLRNQINELSKILVIESQEKQKVIINLGQTEKNLDQTKKDLKNQETLSKELQSNVSKKESELFIQDQNIIALSEQIKKLLNELRIVAQALETYEGEKIITFKTEGLGERINNALSTRISQLKKLNQELDTSNNNLADNEKELEIKISELNKINLDLMAINSSLGLNDAGIVEQLAAIQDKNTQLEISQTAIQDKNTQLEISQTETLKAMTLIEKINEQLVIKDESLQKQILQYVEITNDLLKINDSLGLEDASLLEQLEAIKLKNENLAELNINLIEKDNTIFSLRNKILELNNILAFSEEKQVSQTLEMSALNQSLNLLEEEKLILEQESSASIIDLTLKADETFKQISFLSNEIDLLRDEILILNAALESSEKSLLGKELKIEVLGERLNKALTSKVFELQKYRSEFFGKLKSILGDRNDIKIVGDRFIFESELLFDSASANLQKKGMEKLKEIGLTLKATTDDIPVNIDWIIQVEGHTDKRPIQTAQYPSNWELSTARANSVLKLLLDLGFLPNRLSAAGYGEFYPIKLGDSEEALQENRRIELKLTSR